MARCDVKIDPLEAFENKRVYARLGDLDDSAILRSPGGDSASASWQGGKGDDVLAGGNGLENYFLGGPGDDVMIGSGHFDEGPKRNGSDAITADGLSFIDYSQRSNAVRVDLRDGGGDGERGEGDRVLGTERFGEARVRTGVGPDHLIGNSFDDFLEGGRGRDVIRGGRGDDQLFAGHRPGEPAGEPSAAGDILRGGPGEDVIRGGEGPDRLDGGRGNDVIGARGGRDIVVARDGRADQVFCGLGSDRAVLDADDFVRSTRAFRCERTDRPVPGTAVVIQGPGTEFTAVGDEDGGDLRVACPGDGPRRCRGRARITLRKGTRALLTGRFNIRRNRSTFVSLRPTRFGRRVVCRSFDQDVRALVTSQDRAGKQRTTRGSGYRFECI